MSNEPDKLFEAIEDSSITDYDELGIDPTKDTLDFEGVKKGAQLEQYVKDITESVLGNLKKSIEELAPWFYQNMPTIYYQTTPRAEKVRHLSSIITGHIFDTKQTVALWSDDRKKVTYIGPGNDPQVLMNLAEKVKLIDLKMGSIYYSKDRSIFIATFFADYHAKLDILNSRISKKVDRSRDVVFKDFPKKEKGIRAYFDSLDNDFVIHATANRIRLTYRMFSQLDLQESSQTMIDDLDGSSKIRVTIGYKNSKPNILLENVLFLMDRYKLILHRAFLVNFSNDDGSTKCVVHLILEDTNQQAGKISERIRFLKFNKAVKTLGWVDSDDFDVLFKKPYMASINAANFIRAVSNWVHMSLGKTNAYIYSFYKIRQTFLLYGETTKDLIQLFRYRFDPLEEEERESRYKELREKICHDTEDLVEVEKNIFEASLKFIDNILKTNYFLNTKTGLAFRLDPTILDASHYTKKPFGIFFIIGKDYRFIHVRWKDIARGGLRVVMPKTDPDFETALSGAFDEVYGLSYAQQEKNKDIPEGGAKAVLLLKAGGHREQAVKKAINAFLDLLVSEDESRKYKMSSFVSYYKHPEVIYLGPDENMTNELITWIPEQAQRRGYIYSQAFMSSKPKSGINHKEYGVTSEGVNVFVEEMLHFLKINPRKEDFTVKLTGGPDGDVAGNELKILHREYGEHAKVVAIADGLGAAYDPNGLSWKELLRLVQSSKSIAEFDPKCLSKDPKAYAIKADSKQNIKVRNQLCFKEYADLFVPAGGRPYTVNDVNWSDFLQDGKPTMRAVVEGANIFFTQGARDQLQNQGIYFVKDSSANKTGVICSSYEILASLMLSEEEFAKIKTEYVEQVLDILREKAKYEAKLLFLEFHRSNQQKNLVYLSLEISRKINAVTDAMLDYIHENKKEYLEQPLCQEILAAHFPPVLYSKYKDRVQKCIPEAHIIAILASYMASDLIYKEGLHWINQFSEQDRVQVVTNYLKNQSQVTRLLKEVGDSGLKNKDEVLKILKGSAARELTLHQI